MKKFIIATAMLTATMLVVSSCTGNKVYDEYQHTPITGWEKNDTLTFSVPRMAEEGTYASTLMLRINDGFPFVGLTLIVEQKTIPGMEVKTDTVRCRLIDNGGNFNGQGVSYHQYTFPVTIMPLAAGDSLYISVRHDMKREILPGVSDLGIMIEKTN